MKMVYIIAVFILILFSCGPEPDIEIETAAFYATSYIKNDPVDILKHHPVMAFDQDPLTAWAESSNGPGLGDWLEVKFEQDIEIDSIAIFPGFFDEEKFELFNRIKRVKLNFSDNLESFEVELEDGMTMKKFSFPARTIRSCTFTILEIYPGGNEDISCISGIDFYFEGKKYELAKIDYFKDLLTQNQQLQTPAGFRIVCAEKGVLTGTLYFFPDGTVLYKDGLREKGKWTFDEKTNKIKINLTQRETLEGYGEKILHQSAVGSTEYYENYRYKVVEMDEDIRFDWSSRQERFLNNRGDLYHFFLLTEDDFGKQEFTERPEVRDEIERMKLTYESVKKKS